MTLLITGIHGFVGANLVKALGYKHTIYGLDIVTPQKEGVVQTYIWDDLDKLSEIDAVIHLAGKAHDTKNRTESQVYFDVNLGLTQKMYDWFLKSSAKKFIFFSSVKAAADMVDGDVLTEEVIPTPKGPYGESKIAAENYLREKGEERKGKGTYILRPSMIHGPGNKGNLNLLYGVVKKGIPYPLGAFENKRSFTSIDNLTFVIEQMLEKNIHSGVYNISDDETLSTNELIRLMARIINKPVRFWNLSPKLISWIVKFGTLIHLPLNIERLQKLTESYVVSNEKIKNALNIKQMPVSAIEGFTKTIKSFG